MKPSKIALAAIIPAALVACTGATTIYYSDNMSKFYPDFVRQASASGEMAVEIYGDPFGASGPSKAAIADELRMPPFYGTAKFTTTPKPENAKQRLVMVFNPQHASPGGKAVCSDPKGIALAPAANPMRIEMALCSSKDWVSEATIVGPRGNGVKDPQFRNTLDDGIRELMPDINRNDLDTPCGSPLC
jgi:hypothetical protein